MFGLEYPPVENLVEWPAAFGEGTIFAFNKIALISVLAMLIPTIGFLASKKNLVPSGLQNIVEGSVELVENEVVLPAIGPEGKRYTPFLLTIFLFVFFGNIFEVIPGFQMPANARMANPMFLGLLVLGVFVFIGFKYHGLSYLTGIIWPHDVPVLLRPLVGLIEFLSTFILRPFGLAVRLFANMLAGHILLVTFGVLCITVAAGGLLAILLAVTFPMLVLLTGFEVFVSFLQAFVFALLTAVYIDTSLHPAH